MVEPGMQRLVVAVRQKPRSSPVDRRSAEVVRQENESSDKGPQATDHKQVNLQTHLRMKISSFLAPAIIAIITHVAPSSAYSASVWIGSECAVTTNVQPTFQITGFSMSPNGKSGCIAPVPGSGGTSNIWGSLSLTGCTGTSSRTQIFKNADCTGVVATFNGNSVCEEHLQFRSFSVTGC
ncbi:hypothetical protein CVT26_007286 [Gymnopilus dilepis]|uniref:Uncharacterized protein n=1 Tax=Gymnopilus dilepis TaxID=231916 RepID=A0A409VLR4_9AGAR|nr:hypothetical protein CVT26_007286 [Gymnopilus dilepis]